MPAHLGGPSRRRNHEQVTRQFLSTAYRSHTQTAHSTLGNGDRFADHPSYQVSFSKLEADSFHTGRVMAVVLSLYQPSRKMYLGTRQRIDYSTLEQAKLVFQAPAGSQIVVDVICWDDSDTSEIAASTRTPGATLSAAEKSVAYGVFHLTQTNSTPIDLLLGSSDLLSLDTASRPSAVIFGHLNITVESKSPEYAAALAALTPFGCFVPSKFMDFTPMPVRHFEVKLENIHVTLAPGEEARDALPPMSHFSLALFVHNSYTQLSLVEEVALIKTQEDFLKGSNSVNLSKIPLHSGTSIVACLRHKGRTDPDFLNLGYGMIPLVGQRPMTLKDSDVQFRHVPVLRGPFSGSDERILCMDSRNPFGTTVYRITMDCSFNKCPVPADEVKEIVAEGNIPVDASLASGKSATESLASSREALDASRPRVKGALPPRAPSPDGLPPRPDSKEPVPTKGDVDRLTQPDSEGGEKAGDRSTASSRPTSREGHQPKEVPKATEIQPGQKEIVIQQPAGGGSAPSEIKVRMDQEALPELYAMLKGIAEEVRLVHGRLDEEKSQQQRFRDAMQTASSHIEPRPGDPDDQMVPSVEIMDLDLKRTSITHATRAQLMERVCKVKHPLTKNLLVNGLTSSSQPLLPLSQFGLRFDGLTLPLHQGDQPNSLVVEVSFGLSQFKPSKPMPLHHVTADAMAGRTFSLGSGPGSGTEETVLWLEDPPAESVSFENEALMNSVRAKNMLYLRIYDAESQFYYASASIPLANFHRSPTLAAAMRPKDLPIFVDTTLAMVNPDATFFPLMTSQGQLHVTLLSVGYLRPGAEGQTENDTPQPATVNGLSVPRKVSATSGGNGGALGPMVNGAAGAGSIVVVPKVDVDFGLKGSETTSSALKDTTNQNVTADSAKKGAATSTLHAQRAAYIKKVLQENGGKMPPPKTHVVDQAELEFKLSYADKKKDEIRSAKIASHLKSMVTTNMTLCAARGRPETLRCPFTNPYPVTSTFSIEVPDDFAQNLRLHSKQPMAISLGPKESTSITLVASHDFDVLLDPQASNQRNSKTVEVACSIFSERREVVRVFSVKMECVLPVIDRTFDLFGPSGQKCSKSFFSRTFTAGSLHQPSTQLPGSLSGAPVSASLVEGAGVHPEDDVESITNKIGRLCRYPVVSAPDVEAETIAGVDPITRSKVTAWESVAVTVQALPLTSDQSRRVLIFLYEDSSCESLWETWAITITCCLTKTIDDAVYGQTNSLAVPIKCDKAWSSATNVTVGEVFDGKVDGRQYIVLKAKPRGQGTQAVVVHAQTGRDMERHLLYIPTVLPTVKDDHLARITIPASEAGNPIFRRLPFKNDLLPARQVIVNVSHNYHQYATISPSRFPCGIDQTVTLAIRLEGLQAGEHGSVIKYPLWIFLNEVDTDVSLDVFLVEVLVGGVTPLIQ